MQHQQQKQLSNPVRVCSHRQAIALLTYCLIALLLPTLTLTNSAHADGVADFLLSTSGSGTYTIGNTLTVTLSESGSDDDQANSLSAILTFPSNVQYVSSSQDVFGSCDFGPEAGQVDIECTAPSPVSGTQAVANITFTVISAGPGSFSL